jgi:2-keto-3-deoxy-L-rhamnonate aldolase RhmA
LNPQGEFLIGAMIESLKGEENIEEILDTPGLGAVWIAHPSTEAVGRRILQMCKDRGIIAACSDYDPDHFKARLDEGYRMVFLGWDAMMFSRGLNEVLTIAKQAVDSRK